MKLFRIFLSLLFLASGTAAFAQNGTISAYLRGYKNQASTEGTPPANQLGDQRIIGGVDKQVAAPGLILYHGPVGHQPLVNSTINKRTSAGLLSSRKTGGLIQRTSPCAPLRNPHCPSK